MDHFGELMKTPDPLLKTMSRRFATLSKTLSCGGTSEEVGWQGGLLGSGPPVLVKESGRLEDAVPVWSCSSTALPACRSLWRMLGATARKWWTTSWTRSLVGTTHECSSSWGRWVRRAAALAGHTRALGSCHWCRCCRKSPSRLTWFLPAVLP